jgi:GTPase SAR1 family protein
VLVGNKIDKEDERVIVFLLLSSLCFLSCLFCLLQVIPTELGQKLADQYELKFYETSAKADTNISRVFNHIARTKLKIRATESTVADDHIRLEGKGEKKAEGFWSLFC